MERDSKQIRILSDEYFIDFVCWGDDSKKVYCSGLKGISRHVFSVDIKSGRKEVLVERTGWTYLSGISRDGKTLLTVFRGLLSLPDIRVISLDSGQERAVTQFSNQLVNYELGEASVVEWESYDGLTIQGCVVSPLGKSMSPEHPTIVDVHGGPTEGGAAIFYREWHWLVANGFQIFAPDMRGSQQYQWCEPPTQEPDYKDVMSGIDWLASQRMCDKANMGVHGYSYGAILGAYAIGKSTLFRAAVLLGGLYDYRLTCQYGSQTRWNAISAQEMKGAPWEVPHIYQELSPISYVANVETPVLILEGEHDTPHEAELYTTYLRALGKEVTYVLYKGAGHSLSEVAHRKDRWERTLRWFRKYLIESN
jgi:dipeptidyl aminopeptidase/acylaminoacyl peptidase